MECVHLKRIKKFSNLKKNETTWMCLPKENQDFEETSLAKMLVWVESKTLNLTPP